MDIPPYVAVIIGVGIMGAIVGGAITGIPYYGLPKLGAYLDRRTERRNMERNGYQTRMDFGENGDITIIREPLQMDKSHRWKSEFQW